MEDDILKGKNILLVEDDHLISLCEKMIIKGFGCFVTTAGTGEDAVNIALKNNDIDLILMDINLGPGIDGTEAAKIILKNKNIPIAFLTSHTEEEYVNKIKEITRYGYIIKHSGEYVLKSSMEMALELYNREKLLIEAEKFARFGNWEFDIINKKIFWSDEIYEILEVDKNEFEASYDNLLKYIHVDDKTMVKDIYIKSLETHQHCQLNYRIVMVDGRIKYLHAECETFYDFENNPYRSIGVMQDITDSKITKLFPK